jgi:hypothetical protein
MAVLSLDTVRSGRVRSIVLLRSVFPRVHPRVADWKAADSRADRCATVSDPTKQDFDVDVVPGVV